MACDLHCHSKISDGSLGIDEIIGIARRRGLSALAITDHDAVVGATRAVIVGKRQGIQVIHGVELSAKDPTTGRKAHILAYLCDTPDRLAGLCHRTNTSRKLAATAMMKKVLRYYPIVPDSIVRCAAGSTNIYKQHIMHALMDAGYADGFYGETYYKLFSPENGCAYVPVQYPDVEEVIDLIHSAGGLAVLAHPYTYDSTDLMQSLVKLDKLDGIEVWHPRNNEEQTASLKDFATSHGLLMTGGSDFHGMYTKKPRPLGSFSAPDGTVEMMLDYKKTLYK